MRRPGAPITVLVAWVGVVAGHLAACMLAYPDAAGRHVHEAVTGHAWVRLAAPSLLAVIPVILLTVGIGAVRATSSWSGSGFAARVLAIQVPAFVLIELLVRNGSLAQTLAEPATFIGLVLLPLVAVVSGWILDLFHRAVRAVVARVRRRIPAPAPSVVRPDPGPRPIRQWLLFPARRRAPPLPASA